jgi:hypothetical protein
LAELAPQATAVLQAVLDRAAPGLAAETASLRRPDRQPVDVDGSARPPLVTVPEYGRTGSSELGA